MMYDLNHLADEGRTVVLVTHATANIAQCDYVAFMSWAAGLFGPPAEALAFFGVDGGDFADIYGKLDGAASPQDPDHWLVVQRDLQAEYDHMAAEWGPGVRGLRIRGVMSTAHLQPANPQRWPNCGRCASAPRRSTSSTWLAGWPSRPAARSPAAPRRPGAAARRGSRRCGSSASWRGATSI